mgnify:CR=1 FL=1
MLAPDPGRLPNLPPPPAGETLRLSVDGLPPYKERRFSIRNPRHKDHGRFLALREAATRAMAGRAWVTGPVGLAMWVFAPSLDRDLLEYVGGVMDTLDGSHGPEFTYLPIVCQDDCQVVLGEFHHVRSDEVRYEMQLSFLGAEAEGREGELPNNPLQRTGSAGR